MATKAKASTRFIDLDAAVEEQEAIVIAFAGESYELPGSVDASVVMSYLRHADGVIPTDEVYKLFGNLVGTDNLQDMLDRGLSYAKLEFLTKWLLAEYGIMNEAEEGDSPN